MSIRLSLICLLIGLSLAIRIKKSKSSKVRSLSSSADAAISKIAAPMPTVKPPPQPTVTMPDEPVGSISMGQVFSLGQMGERNPPTQEQWNEYNRQKREYERAMREYQGKLQLYRKQEEAYNAVVEWSDQRLRDWRGWEGLKSQPWLKDRPEVTHEAYLLRCEQVAVRNADYYTKDLAREVVDFFGFGAYHQEWYDKKTKQIEQEAKQKMGGLTAAQKEQAMSILHRYLKDDSDIVDGRFMPLLEMTLRMTGGLGKGPDENDHIKWILGVWKKGKFIHDGTGSGYIGDLRSERNMAKIARLTAEDAMKDKEWNFGAGKMSALQFIAKYNPGAESLDRSDEVLHIGYRPDRTPVAAPPPQDLKDTTVWDRRTPPAGGLGRLYRGVTPQRAENLYLLGLPSSEFTEKDLTSAYRKAARECHPDKQTANSEQARDATALFQAVSQAQKFLAYKEH